MGYTTRFDGAISIEPALSAAQVAKLTAFCKERHNHQTHPGTYCDWEVWEDGTAISWNESEKSYSMEEWAVHLIQNFLQGHMLNGTLSAQGEEPDDMWLLHVRDSVVSTEDLVAKPSGSERVIGGQQPQITETKLLGNE